MTDTQYVHKLGISADWKFIDVYDLSSDGLQSVPRPIAAALFLFPVSLSPQVGTCVACAHPVLMLSLTTSLYFYWMLCFVVCDVACKYCICDIFMYPKPYNTVYFYVLLSVIDQRCHTILKFNLGKLF